MSQQDGSSGDARRTLLGILALALGAGLMAALGDLAGGLLTRGERFDPQIGTVQLIGLVLLADVLVVFALAVVVLLVWRLVRKSELSSSALCGVALVLPITIQLVFHEDPPAFQQAPITVSQEKGERPHILWILIDTLRSDTIYGENFSFPDAPKIKRLADESLVFHKAQSPSSWTIPSTATLLSGIHCYSLDANKGYLAGDAPSLPEVLSAAGYRTRAVVDNALIDPNNGFGVGFEEFVKRTPMEFAFSLLAWQMLPVQVRDKLKFGLYVTYSGAERSTDRALTFLEEDDERPLFLYAHYMDPHAPYVDHPEYGPPPANAEDLGFTDKHSARNVRSGERQLTEGQRAMLDHLYSTELRYADDHVGRLIDAFTERFGRENSIVVLTSDHGQEFFEHGEMGHGTSLYDEMIHVPLILRSPDPRLGEPRVVEQSVSLVDVMPTTLDLAGITLNESEDWLAPQGASLVPILAEGASNERRLFSFQDRFRRRIFRWRRGSHVFIESTRGRRDTVRELYDVSADPGERNDLAGEQKALFDELAGELHGFVELLDAQKTSEGGGQANRDALRALGYAGD